MKNKTKIAVIASLIIVNFFIVYGLYDSWDRGLGFFVILPLLCTAFFYGMKGGAVAGLLAHPLNNLYYTIISGAIPETLLMPAHLTAWGFAFFVAVLVGYLRDSRVKYQTALVELQQAHRDLKRASDRIKILSGLIPICTACKKIRDDSGFWNNLESYIEKHSDAEFSHGICPACQEELYGGEEWSDNIRKKRKL